LLLFYLGYSLGKKEATSLVYISLSKRKERDEATNLKRRKISL
jgi:hypothetical protein